MITLHSVSKELGKGHFKALVLESISWTIPRHCRIAILGQRGSGISVLLEIIAGLSLPTEGWVDRNATISIPGGYLRYSRSGTARQLAKRLAQLYRADPEDILNFVTSAIQRSDIVDVPIRQLPPAFRHQLNLALTYAVPCDFYCFNGSIDVARPPRFRAFCQRAFAMRSEHAGIIVATSSSRAAAALGKGFMGGILFRSKLTLYERLDDAIAVFDSLPLEENASIPRDALIEEDPMQEQDDIF